MPATQVAGIFVMGFVRGKLSRLKAALVGYTDGSLRRVSATYGSAATLPFARPTACDASPVVRAHAGPPADVGVDRQ